MLFFPNFLAFAPDFCNSSSLQPQKISIVGKEGHTPFLDEPTLRFQRFPLLEIQDVSTFHGFIGKTEQLNNSCSQFLYNFYHQSILIL